MIRKVGGEICVLSESIGKNGQHKKLGCYSIAEYGLKGARAKAHKRLGQVEGFAKRED